MRIRALFSALIAVSTASLAGSAALAVPMAPLDPRSDVAVPAQYSPGVSQHKSPQVKIYPKKKHHVAAAKHHGSYVGQYGGGLGSFGRVIKQQPLEENPFRVGAAVAHGPRHHSGARLKYPMEDVDR